MLDVFVVDGIDKREMAVDMVGPRKVCAAALATAHNDKQDDNTDDDDAEGDTNSDACRRRRVPSGAGLCVCNLRNNEDNKESRTREVFMT
jgi:hypothetical protein